MDRGRRNIPAYERARLALRLKPIIAERAKENQGARNDICQKSDKSIDTKKELAAAAGVSHDTIAKVERIEKQAPETWTKNAGQDTIHHHELNISRQQHRKPEQRKLGCIGSYPCFCLLGNTEG